jgi:hypothetical protein
MLNIVLLSILFIYYYDECRYDECHYAECHNAECRYAECRYVECHYAECHYAECRGATFKPCLAFTRLSKMSVCKFLLGISHIFKSVFYSSLMIGNILHPRFF